VLLVKLLENGIGISILIAVSDSEVLPLHHVCKRSNKHTGELLCCYCTVRDAKSGQEDSANLRASSISVLWGSWRWSSWWGRTCCQTDSASACCNCIIALLQLSKESKIHVQAWTIPPVDDDQCQQECISSMNYQEMLAVLVQAVHPAACCSALEKAALSP